MCLWVEASVNSLTEDKKQFIFYIKFVEPSWTVTRLCLTKPLYLKVIDYFRVHVPGLIWAPRQDVNTHMRGLGRDGGCLCCAGIPEGNKIKGMLVLSWECVALKKFLLAPATINLREINVHAYWVPALFEMLPYSPPVSKALIVYVHEIDLWCRNESRAWL